MDGVSKQLMSEALKFLGIDTLERPGYTLKEYRNFWNITIEHEGELINTCVLAYLCTDLEPSELSLRRLIMHGLEHESLSGVIYRCEMFYNNLYMLVCLDDEIYFPMSIYDFYEGSLTAERIYSMLTSVDTRYLVEDVYDNETVLCNIGGTLKVMNWSDICV